jgi:hypothetical protein
MQHADVAASSSQRSGESESTKSGFCTGLQCATRVMAALYVRKKDV